uniref:PH domain-containing protein n=1 Tax=Vannella robusta TaxID=1487602 RepID=A0A7S4HMU1_9EUKA|mmetsp:Transcript_12920/g.16143  ORF Transcript_12920/g.16143 Transcript_12920/m.16143 type:complete len:141 (+) Transcript_12920:132-554(+)
MCYRAHEEMADPVLVFRLQNHKIVPIAERDIGRKYCFLLTTTSKSYYFSAANPQVLMKWINVLSDVVAWYQSEDEILFRDWELEEGKPLRKCDSEDRSGDSRLKLNLNLSMLKPSRDSPATARTSPSRNKYVLFLPNYVL